MKASYGFFSFTEVTDPLQHAAYNAWHQLDHLPEQYPLPGIVHGRRWVSTPACRAARAVNGPALDPIHYLTCYLMAEPIEQTLDDFFALGAELRRLDRFFGARRAHLTGPFRVTGTSAARRVLVSAAAVPFRPHRGVYVIVEDAATAADAAPARPDDPGVAGVWTFTTNPDVTSRRWSEGALAHHGGVARRRAGRGRRAARAGAQPATRRGVRGSVRDDHAGGVGLVRLTTFPLGRETRLSRRASWTSGTIAHTNPIVRASGTQNITTRPTGVAPRLSRGTRNAAAMTPPCTASQRASRSVGRSAATARPSTVYQAST